MENKIYMQELVCYKKASEEIKNHKLLSSNRYFDLDKLPTEEMKNEMRLFILERGSVLTPLSMRTELYPYNLLCKFLSERYPLLKSVANIEIEQMEKEIKMWLFKKGKNISQNRIKTATGNIETTDVEILKYIRKVYSFIDPKEKNFRYESSKWYLDDFPFTLRTNPTKEIGSLSFEKIKQVQIKDEVKQIIYIHLSQKALGTVNAEITEINRFSNYLFNRYPEVQSLQEVDRELLERYLIYTNTEAGNRKSYCKGLCHLKEIFITAGKVLENKELEILFYKDDIGKPPSRIYKVYSDSELKRLNAAIVERDEQIARVLVLHQLLGTRISETLTLKRNSIYKGKSGNWMIKIRQIKTSRSFEKAIDQNVKKLFDKACEYTQEHYGNTEYVFVTEKDPSKPMQYGRIQYHLMAMVTQNDLKDDNGVRFGVGTHIWRHCYGKKLTELHVDDITIAKLMGHANTNSLKYYRKVGNEMLSEETRTMRESKDEVIRKIIGEWQL